MSLLLVQTFFATAKLVLKISISPVRPLLLVVKFSCDGQPGLQNTESG